MTPFQRQLVALIAEGGPIPVGRFIGMANAHYYGSRDPLGAAGDFITAPEISQMFGELIGLWLADRWQRAGAPGNAVLVELGPGRGTLMADVRRALRGVADLADAPVHFVETSAALKAAQAARHPDAYWHDGVESLPGGVPLLVIANEFFDALPVRQMVRTAEGWRERMIGLDGDKLAPAAGTVPSDALVPAGLRDAPVGSIFEISPASTAIMADLAARIETQGGAALIVDYGYRGPAIGDTLQAVRAHRFADPFADAGEVDLTAHVDFTGLAAAAARAGARCEGVFEQGAFLKALGIERRAAALAKTNPARAEALAAEVARLTGADEMGTLFKVLAISASDWS